MAKQLGKREENVRTLKKARHISNPPLTILLLLLQI